MDNYILTYRILIAIEVVVGLYVSFSLTVASGKFKFTISLDIKAGKWYGVTDPIYIETVRLVTITVS